MISSGRKLRGFLLLFLKNSYFCENKTFTYDKSCFDICFCGEFCSRDNPELTRQCTVARLLRDYVALQDDISPRRIFNIDESRLGSPIKVVDIIAAIDWMCVEISNYLESHSVEIDDVAFRVLTFEENKVYSGVNEKLKVMKERYSKSNMETVMMRLSQQISGCDSLCIPDQEK